MKADRSCMMLTSEALTCAFVTTHVGYHEVPALLTAGRILEVIELAAAAMHRIRERELDYIINWDVVALDEHRTLRLPDPFHPYIGESAVFLG